jgi:deazaflavin-dependent oxidoreductase (nitroreductase family)
MSRRRNPNEAIIEEFRNNGGKVGGPFRGAAMLLLHTRGAKSGQERVNPMVYQALEGDDVAVFASKGGAPTNPDWYYNLLANPRVTVEIGNDIRELTAHVARGEERERIWSKQKADLPGFAEYERKTSREIPVIVLKSTSSEPA